MQHAIWRGPQSIASKLTLVASFTLLTILALAIQAIVFAISSYRTADRVYADGFVELITITKLASAIEAHRRIVESAPAEVDRAVLGAERKQLGGLNSRISELLKSSNIGTITPTEPAADVSNDVAMMIQLGLRTNDYAEAFALDMAKQTVAEYNIHASRVALLIAQHRAERVALSEAAFSDLKSEAIRLMGLISLTFGAALMIVAPLGGLVVHGMLRRLKATHQVVSTLSRGELDIEIPFSRDSDEIGDVARALQVLHVNAKAHVEHRQELAKRNKELALLSDTLEQRVTERTAEAKEAESRAKQINHRLLGEIDAKNKIAESLRTTNEELLSATKAKSEFLANVSHEIRTPIMGVLGMSDLLLKGRLAKQQRHFAETIAKSAQILLAIVNDILDLSRMDAGKLTLDNHAIVVDSFVEDVAQVSASSAMKKKLRLDVIIERDVPRRIIGDSMRLRQVLLNLVTNAIKFTSTGGVTVRVETLQASHGPRFLSISIRDTGIGISPEQQSRLFSAFSQADPSITRRFGGTGLGLVISKNLIELMGGSIGIESELGVGTEVSFRIPLVNMAGATSERHETTRDMAAGVPGQDDSGEMPALAGRRIAYIADTADGREALRTRLARLGADVVAFEHADAAIARYALDRTSIPDAIVVATTAAATDGQRIAALGRGMGFKMRVLVSDQNAHGDAATADAVEHIPWPALSGDIVSAISADPGEASKPRATARTAVDDADDDPARDAPSATNTSGPRILIAEDNPINQEVILEYLAALGCRAVMTDNGEAALEAFVAASFDVVLLDCQMPRMDGYMAAQRMRETEAAQGRKRAPILAITANTYDSDRQKCLASGMDWIISKPFTQEQLADGLRREGGLTLTEPRALAPPEPSSAVVSPPAERGVTASAATPADADALSSVSSIDTRRLGRCQPAVDAALRLPVLEAVAVETLSKKNPKLLQRMIDLYGRHTPATVAELEKGLAHGEWQAVKVAAHTLKSSSKSLGAERLASLLAALELQSGALARGVTDGAGPDEVAELATLAIREAETALAALDRRRNSPRDRETA